MRTFATAGKSAVIGDLFRFYAVTLREFFELGRQRAQAGSSWFTDPPGLQWRSEP